MAAILAVAVGVCLIPPVALAAYTDHFEALETELTSRAATLGGSTDKTELKQAKACLKAIAAIEKSTTSLATDIKAAGKVAKTLQKAFPNEFSSPIGPLGVTNNLQDLLTDVFVALGEDIQGAIDGLQETIDALPAGNTRDKTQVAHDRAQMSLDEAAGATDFPTVAKLDSAAVKAVLKGLKIVIGGGGGIGGSLTMKVNGSSWKALVAGGDFDPIAGEFNLVGVSTHPDSTLTVMVPSGVTGPGTYSLPAGLTFYITRTDVYQNTGGTLTITTLNVAGESATGTFSFTGNPIGGGSAVNITDGAFAINELTVF